MKECQILEGVAYWSYRDYLDILVLKQSVSTIIYETSTQKELPWWPASSIIYRRALLLPAALSFLRDCSPPSGFIQS